MYLRSLDIQGFKSFPDKVHIDFSSGVTAIVGPNGSGKSNIVDAVRWTLGEQSVKNLRGGRMEDVIFGGTTRRKPLGFCEATLTVDNRGGGLPVEYDQVAVTRRYYRSGESEFFINKKAVRLKDVRELLMDTGLGREGYSVIGQGRIDEILAAKGGDRREIFEEAAGITKFRYRKAEAERKLEGTEENLVRIRDIVAELAAQAAPLKIQAEQARKFLLLRDDLRALEVSLWMDGLEKLGENRRKAQTDFENAGRSVSARRRQLEELYAQSQRLADQNRQKELEAEGARQALREEENRLSALQSRQAVAQANLENNRQNARRLQAELAEQTGRRQEAEERRQKQLEQLALLEGRLAELEEQDRLLTQSRQEAALAREQAVLRLQELEEELRRLEERRRRLELEQAALASGQAEMDSQGQGLAGEIERAQIRLEEQQGRLEQGEQEIACRQAEEKRWKAQADGLEAQRQDRRQKTGLLARQTEDLRRRLTAAQDRAALLQGLEREYEGFSRAARRVLQAADKGTLSGVRGPVSRLLQAEDRYTVAVETALGAAVSHIVTEDEGDAKAAILFLKKGDLGRATFLPLTALRSRKTDSGPLEGQPGFVAMADQLVRRKPEYDTLAESLLGATAVAEDIDSAVRLARRFSYRYRIVTLDGQLINPSGAMTGGSLNKNAGMFSRANEIRRLGQEQKQLKKQLQDLEEQSVQADRRLNETEEERNQAGEKLRQIQNHLLSLRAEQGQRTVLLESLAQALESLQAEQRQSGARQRQAQLERRQQEEQLEELGRTLTELEERRAQRRQELADAEGQSAALDEENQRLQRQIVGEGSALAAQRQGAEQMTALLEALGGQDDEKLRAIQQLEEDNRRLEQELAQGEEQRRQLLVQAEQKQQEIERISQQKMDIEALRVKADKEAQQQNDGLMNMEREQARLEAKKNQAELEEKQILDRMWEAYELTPTAAQAIRQPLESLGKTQREAARLREEIKGLGAVNLGAVEEYQRVNGRYTFMEEQRQDLEQAKGDLEQVISRLTQNMRQIFAREFEKINGNFGRTFARLFGGGAAWLELEDPADILNCGIEIHAELPGKSRRVISLLSGGEKALTAIALYFAILETRPTPFCILDEIEASLDDVNVLRYMDYLRSLCGQTQFILITHRRGAMEGADILYGAAMQEQGVTKLLKLELNEAEQKIKAGPRGADDGRSE